MQELGDRGGGTDWDALLHDMTFVAFDTETTGLSAQAGRVVEIAAVRFSLREGILDTFQSLINPGMPIPPDASHIHGIRDAHVRDQPPASVVLRDFFKFIDGPGQILVAHNAPFDTGFLKAECARHRLPTWSNPVLCTLALSRAYLRGLRNYQLATVAEHLGVQRPARLHRALADSMLVHGIITSLLVRLPAEHLVVELRRVHPGWSPPKRTPAAIEPRPISPALGSTDSLATTLAE